MTFAARLGAVLGEIAAACESCDRDPAGVDLLPVSKQHPVAAIREALATGLDTFGENRVQELGGKAAELVDLDLAWHLIGSLQTNKVHQLLRIPGLALVHSVDRVRLADALQQALDAPTPAAKTPVISSRTLDVLIQINATTDASKHGVAPADAMSLLRHIASDCPALNPVGVMAMGPQRGDPAPVFERVARIHEDLRQGIGLPLPIRSMGMTADLRVAIARGSTLVRIGTALFGDRP